MSNDLGKILIKKKQFSKALFIFKKILKNKPNTLFAVLGGAITDNHGRKVLEYGDVVKTRDFKVFSKVFKINKSLSLLKVTKNI